MVNIKQLVEKPHEIYRNYFKYWSFLLESYEGGVDYTKSSVTGNNTTTSTLEVLVNGKAVPRGTQANLFKHKKEREEDFTNRIDMSYFYNFNAPIIDIYTEHLFKQPVIEDYANIQSIVDSRLENVDRMGSSMDEFRKEVGENAQIYGHCFVVVDMPMEIGEVSLEQRQQTDRFPYFVIYSPDKVINWSLDQFGKAHWVLLCDRQDSNVDPFNYDPENKVDTTYRLWTRTEWVVYGSDFEEVDRGVNPTGEVPIVCVKDKASKKVKNFLGISSLADIAFISRDIFNLSSELQELIRNQTFAFLALNGKATDYSEATIGTNRGLIYPHGFNAPVYVSPPPANADIIMSQINNQISQIYSLAKLEGGSGQFKGQNAVAQSGVGKAWDFNQTNSSLTKKASNLEDAEIKMWQLFAKWEGKEFEGSIEYSREFDVTSLMDDLAEAQELAKLNLGDMVNKEVNKAIIQKKFPRKPDADIDLLVKDMEIAPKPQDKQPSLFNRLGLKPTTKSGEQT